MNEKTKEYRQQIAEIFIRSLEEKQLDWKKEWNAQAILPVNAINNKRYKGINKFWLGLVAMSRSTDDPRWCTFKQIQDKGWKLNKGSKGAKVEYWMPYDKKEKKGITWDDYRKRNGEPSVTLVSRYYVVFNGKDIEGIPPLPPLEVNSINPDEIIDKLSKNIEVEILNDGGDRAFYSPIEDQIHLPKPEYFETDYAYNATALHEIAHSTGAAHRLNRNIMNMFSSSDYAYEELIAEITSCFMSINLKMIQDENHVNNHKAYVQGWIKVIREKPETLIKAIREAEKTANYMEYKAELISEKDYRTTLNESIEVSENDIQKDIKEYGITKESEDVSNKANELKALIGVKYYKYFYSGEQDKEANAFQQENGWHKIWASDTQGMNGDTWIVYRNADDLPKFLQEYAREQEAIDGRKSMKDIQKNIDEYKKINLYSVSTVKAEKNNIKQER